MDISYSENSKDLSMAIFCADALKLAALVFWNLDANFSWDAYHFSKVYFQVYLNCQWNVYCLALVGWYIDSYPAIK